MSWYRKRETIRIEDEAYCLLGIFEVNMPLIYGEGRRAFRRLQEEIAKRSNDLTLFAHNSKLDAATKRTELLAVSPRDFLPTFGRMDEEYNVVSNGIRFSEPVSLYQICIVAATETQSATTVHALWIGSNEQHHLLYLILQKFAPGKFSRHSNFPEIYFARGAA